jgi:hypothetical protein
MRREAPVRFLGGGGTEMCRCYPTRYEAELQFALKKTLNTHEVYCQKSCGGAAPPNF